MEQTKEARKIKRQIMIDNKLSLYNFYMSAGREFLHDILEVYTSPKILFEKVKNSSYYSSLNENDRHTLEIVNEENSFSELEIDLAFELLKRFTSIKTPKCEWCEDCLKCDTDFSHEGENLEVFMNIWKNVVCKSNFISEEKFSEYTGVLWNTAENLCKTFACGKRLTDMLECGLFQKQNRPNNIHILSHGKELNIQIGDNNKTFLKMVVFDHVGPTSKAVPKENDMSSDELVKMILHLHPTSSSGISIARIEERFLLSLCGRKLDELNEILKERFGVEIIVTRKGCIVLILRKIDNSQWFFETFSRLEMFLKDVFMFVTSVDVLSGLICSLDITKTQEVEKSATSSDFSVELILKPAANFKSMSDKKMTDLVSTIIDNGYDKGDHDITDDIEITAEVYYIRDKKNNRGKVLKSTILGSGSASHNYESCALNQQNSEYPGLNKHTDVDSISSQQNSIELGSIQYHIRSSKLSKQYHNHLKTNSESGKFQQYYSKPECNPTNTHFCRSFPQNIFHALSNRNEDKVTETFQQNTSGLATGNESGLFHANNKFDELIDQYNPCTEYIQTNTDGQPRSDAPGLIKPNFNDPSHMQHCNHYPGCFSTNKFSQPRSDDPELICPKRNVPWSNVNYFCQDKYHSFQCNCTDAESPLHDLIKSVQRKEIIVPEKRDSKPYEMCKLLRWACFLLFTVLLIMFVRWTAVSYQKQKPEECIKNRVMMMNYQRSLWESMEKFEFQLGISAKFSEQFEKRLTVRYMNMSSKGLDAIDFSFLKSFPKMEVLDISYNKMEYLTLNSTLSNLKIIVMQSNILLSVKILKRLPSLRVMSLRCNRIRHISTETLSNLHRLEFLDLSFNPITRIKFDPSLLTFTPNLLQDKNEKVVTTCELDVKTIPKRLLSKNMRETLTEQRDSILPVNIYNSFYNKMIDIVRKTNYIKLLFF